MEAPPRSSAPDVSLKDLRECRNFFQPDLGKKKSQGKPDLLGMEKIYFGEMKKRKNYDERSTEHRKYGKSWRGHEMRAGRRHKKNASL